MLLCQNILAQFLAAGLNACSMTKAFAKILFIEGKVVFAVIKPSQTLFKQ